MKCEKGIFINEACLIRIEKTVDSFSFPGKDGEETTIRAYPIFPVLEYNRGLYLLLQKVLGCEGQVTILSDNPCWLGLALYREAKKLKKDKGYDLKKIPVFSKKKFKNKKLEYLIDVSKSNSKALISNEQKKLKFRLIHLLKYNTREKFSKRLMNIYQRWESHQ